MAKELCTYCSEYRTKKGVQKTKVVKYFRSKPEVKKKVRPYVCVAVCNRCLQVQEGYFRLYFDEATEAEYAVFMVHTA